MRNAFLVGKQVYLRPLEREDARRLAEMLNDRSVTRTLVVHRPVTILGEERFVERLEEREHDLVLGIVERESDELVGVTGLHGIDGRNRHADFGIFIGDPRRWGRGYGTEATRLIVDYGFDTLNLHRIQLDVYEDNPAGRHVYEKVGFRVEGVRRDDTFRRGRFRDTIVMGVLRDEWTSADETGQPETTTSDPGGPGEPDEPHRGAGPPGG